MTVSANVTRELTESSKSEILTMDDVERIVAKRLNWYGLDQLAIQSLERLPDHRIEAKIVDLAAKRTYRRVFDIYPSDVRSRKAAEAIAA